MQKKYGAVLIDTSFNNVQNCFEFLDSTHNDMHYNEGFEKIFHDTAIVNGLSEILRTVRQLISNVGLFELDVKQVCGYDIRRGS